MVNVIKEALCLNRVVAEKKEIIFAQEDMIVPDSKPDILNTISTSGVVCIYKKEIQEGKIKIDGNVNTYIMYMPDGEEEGVRGLNTSLDFSENIEIPNCLEGMQANIRTKIKSMECKVINGRKIGIKVAIEVQIKIYNKEEIEIVNDIPEMNGIQMLKENVTVNSLIGEGDNKIYAKDTIQIDSIDLLAEILKVNIDITDKDIKVSYNKVLAKAEANIKIMYLTEDNRVNQVTCRIPTVGFIDIPNISEDNICDVNYEIKNLVIKPNAQEEHSIYIEMEIGVSCNVYEEKQINFIQDLYHPDINLNIGKKQVLTMSGKKTIKGEKQIREKINIKDVEGMTLLDVDILPEIIKEDKIYSKILYEGELGLKFTFLKTNSQIETREAKIPFDYVLEDLENAETMRTNNEIEIKNQDFIIQDGGNITSNIDLGINTDIYKVANMNLIDTIEENGEREEQDYSLIIYIVKKDDTLWNIAKQFGSTVDDIARTNGIENRDLIMPSQKLYIPKYIKTPAIVNG